jgi:putative DNA primase/helicase
MALGKAKSAGKSRKTHALQCAAHGWPVLPLHGIVNGNCKCASGESCSHAGKHPRTTKGVHNATRDTKRIKSWFNKWPDCNFGVATGEGMFVLDIDRKIGRKSLDALQAEHGVLPRTVTVKTGKGRHLYFRCEGVRVGNSAGHLGKGLDVRGVGGYVVGAGSVHRSGKIYQYIEGRALGEIKLAHAPQWLLDKICSSKISRSTNDAPTVSPIPAAKLARAHGYADAARSRELDRLRKAPKHQRNETLNRAACKLGQFLPYGLVDQAAVTSELARVAAEIGLDDQEIGPTIRSGMTAGSQYPRRLPFLKSDDRVRTVDPPTTSGAKLTAELAKLGETDSDNAQRFARRFGSKVIYTPGQGWLVYDGKRWRRDDLLQVTELAKKTARRIADESRHLHDNDARAARSKFSAQSLGKGALDRMLDLAKSLVGVQDKWLDADPWLLNVENGTVDLRTGAFLDMIRTSGVMVCSVSAK